MKKIALVALALIACEEPAEETLAQIAADAGEALADAAREIHDASTADAQSDASTDKPVARRALESACVDRPVSKDGQVIGHHAWARFDVGMEDVRSVWVCGAPVDQDVIACPAGTTCTGPVPQKSDCAQTSGVFAEGSVWVNCAGYASAKLVTD